MSTEPVYRLWCFTMAEPPIRVSLFEKLMLRRVHQKMPVIPVKTKNPCWQASWLPRTSRCVPTQMDSAPSRE
jgi:hypothetical protein